MKHLFFLTKLAPALLAAVVLSGCAEEAPSLAYVLEMPEVPEAWLEVLGAPSWRLSWVSGSGEIVEAATDGERLEAEIMQAWPSAMIAWPCWPEKDLRPGALRPAGAIFPLDARDGVITLSWRGGVDAFFYFELTKGGSDKRAPYRFDWKRFRTLFTDGSLAADVAADPWLADWDSLARQTIATGFDKRRIKARNLGNLIITPPCDGPWVGVSPLAAPADWEADIPVSIPRRASVDTWFSPAGCLRCGEEALLWREWQPAPLVNDSG